MMSREPMESSRRELRYSNSPPSFLEHRGNDELASTGEATTIGSNSFPLSVGSNECVTESGLRYTKKPKLTDSEKKILQDVVTNYNASKGKAVNVDILCNYVQEKCVELLNVPPPQPEEEEEESTENCRYFMRESTIEGNKLQPDHVSVLQLPESLNEGGVLKHALVCLVCGDKRCKIVTSSKKRRRSGSNIDSNRKRSTSASDLCRFPDEKNNPCYTLFKKCIDEGSITDKESVLKGEYRDYATLAAQKRRTFSDMKEFTERISEFLSCRGRNMSNHVITETCKDRHKRHPDTCCTLPNECLNDLDRALAYWASSKFAPEPNTEVTLVIDLWTRDGVTVLGLCVKHGDKVLPLPAFVVEGKTAKQIASQIIEVLISPLLKNCILTCLVGDDDRTNHAILKQVIKLLTERCPEITEMYPDFEVIPFISCYAHNMQNAWKASHRNEDVSIRLLQVRKISAALNDSKGKPIHKFYQSILFALGENNNPWSNIEIDDDGNASLRRHLTEPELRQISDSLPQFGDTRWFSEHDQCTALLDKQQALESLRELLESSTNFTNVTNLKAALQEITPDLVCDICSIVACTSSMKHFHRCLEEDNPITSRIHLIFRFIQRDLTGPWMLVEQDLARRIVDDCERRCPTIGDLDLTDNVVSQILANETAILDALRDAEVERYEANKSLEHNKVLLKSMERKFSAADTEEKKSSYRVKVAERKVWVSNAQRRLVAAEYAVESCTSEYKKLSSCLSETLDFAEKMISIDEKWCLMRAGLVTVAGAKARVHCHSRVKEYFDRKEGHDDILFASLLDIQVWGVMLKEGDLKSLVGAITDGKVDAAWDALENKLARQLEKQQQSQQRDSNNSNNNTSNYSNSNNNNLTHASIEEQAAASLNASTSNNSRATPQRSQYKTQAHNIVERYRKDMMRRLHCDEHRKDDMTALVAAFPHLETDIGNVGIAQICLFSQIRRIQAIELTPLQLWENELGNYFPSLKNIAKSVLSLTTNSACVERLFSILKYIYSSNIYSFNMAYRLAARVAIMKSKADEENKWMVPDVENEDDMYNFRCMYEDSKSGRVSLPGLEDITLPDNE